ncbi:MAG TPA: DUF1552 domain-containing protein [Polyangiaceae bacterium]
MSQRPKKLGRRHFLTGLGGFALAIPFLPSLEKQASGASAAARPNFFYLGSDHGGCWDDNFFPTSAMPNSVQAASGHTVTSGPLSAPVSGGTARMSAVLNASSAALSSALVAKMNVLRGLDVPWYIAHNTGLHLGNFARNDGNGGDNLVVAAMGMRPTIDQLMANSSSFYTSTDTATTKLKAMIMNSGRQLSWSFAVPTQGVQSAVQSVQGVNSSLQLFNSIFGGDPPAGPAPRKPVVDKILANYKSLRQGNTRLSAADKARLDTHIAMLAQLQSSLNARVSCTRPSTPTEDTNSHRSGSKSDTAKYGQLWMDVVAAAFACGASRIGVLGFGDTAGFSDYSGTDWHHDVAHQWYQDPPQGFLVQSYQGLFEQVFVYLAAKLEQLDAGNGQTVLDNSLLVWSQESGMETHGSYGVPVVTFGGAAGSMNSGLYCDYRQNGQSGAVMSLAQAAGGMGSAKMSSYVTYPGMLYEQWLASAIQLMGVPKSEFELWKDSSGNLEHGVGTPYLGADKPYAAHYGSLASSYFQNASNLLPFLAKA